MKELIGKKEIAKSLESTLLDLYARLGSNVPSKKTKKFIARSSKDLASEIRGLLKEQLKDGQKAARKELKKAEKQTAKKLKDKKTKKRNSHSKESLGASILI